MTRGLILSGAALFAALITACANPCFSTPAPAVGMARTGRPMVHGEVDAALPRGVARSTPGARAI